MDKFYEVNTADTLLSFIKVQYILAACNFGQQCLTARK